jgi:ParB/RepB/Spo0J family partition protein
MDGRKIMPIETVAIEKIRENPVALRAVNKQSEDYLGIVDSIRRRGFLGSITGRKKKDEAGQEFIEITDGLHRYSAARDAGIKQLPVDILTMDDAATLEAQIMLNVHKVETKPVQYSQQLRRILSMNPLMTEAELAGKLGKSAAWIKERLGLVKLPDKVGQLVDSGKINLSNAYAIAKLPTEEMADWVDRAMTQAPQEFIPAINGRIKEVKDAKRKGLDAADAEFVPVAHMQKLTTLKQEMEKPAVGPVLLKKHKINDPVAAFNLGVKWALHMDPDSIDAARIKHDEQLRAREEAKAVRRAEREKTKAEEAAKAAAEASEAVTKLGKK